MTNIRDIRLADILPPNIAKDNKARGAAQALDDELQAVTAAVDQCLLLARIDKLPENIIDVLAWQYHVDYFYENFPTLLQKREIVKQSLGWHMYKGTVASVEEAVSLVFNEGEVVEWFEYNGQPYCFMLKVCENTMDIQKLTRLLYLIKKTKNKRSWLECIMGVPDRMLLLNQAGALVTVTQDLSWQETKTWKVFTGPRFNAAGAVEAVTEDTSWSETITFKTFIGPRLNGPSLKLNGTGRANEGPTSTQQQVIQHPGSLTYKRFIAPVAALNARGNVIEDVVDHGWDETITEHRFTGPRFNSPQTLTMTGQARLNAGPKTSEQVVVHHPVLDVTVKNNGGTLLNRGPTETRQEITNHPDVRTHKKFNPEAGMVLNGKPVLGYMWKKELKEAV